MAIFLAFVLALGSCPARTDLTVTVWPKGKPAPRKVWTLGCDPARGTHPRAASACRVLAALKESPFAPVPRDSVCTQIFGGPQEARVTGTFRGKRVWASFNRRDGCQIQRWNRLVFLFLTRGGAAP